MTDGVAGVVLAAGLGLRLRPLTHLRPKALCPVDNVALVDLAIERVRSAVPDVAVNVHDGRAAMEEYLAGVVHLSVEEREPLGTAGALAHLRGWLDGRGALVVNADAWCPGSLAAFVDGWDRAGLRLLIPGEDELRPTSAIAGALMPWGMIEPLSAEPSGLYETVWARAQAEGRLEVVRHEGQFIDCGTPRQYLAANLAANEGASVESPDAEVLGKVDRCVVWPGAVVWPGEQLSCAIRYDEVSTVLIR